MKPEKSIGLSAFALKLIAAVSMITDHVGLLLSQHAGSQWETLWTGMRIFGRLAFPLYCFLLAEGFLHTGNVKKYMLRLGIFAVISELPFNYLISQQLFYPDYQNVMVTLLIGLAMLYLYNGFVSRTQPIYAIMVLISALCLAFAVECDYGAEGVLMIFLFYLFRFRPLLMIVSVGAVMVLMGGLEVFGLLAFIPILFYNEKKGGDFIKGQKAKKAVQYGAYALYPVHLTVLSIISYLLG